jgi:putative hemolysin
MAILSRISFPFVWLLDGSGRLVLRLIGQKSQPPEKVTEEEVRSIISEAELAGVIESGEREMISAVMRFADCAARALMTPRREVEVIDLGDSPDAIRNQVRTTRRVRLPVQEGDTDAIIGVVSTKDLFDALADGSGTDVRSLVQKVPVVLDTSRAFDVLGVMRAANVHMVLVFDEFGHFEGVITSSDVLEAITGAFQNADTEEPAYVQREDGSLLVAGWMPIDEFNEKIGVPVERDLGYETVAGLILATLNRLPKVGETFEKGDWHFEVVDIDGWRIDKVIVTKRLP